MPNIAMPLPDLLFLVLAACYWAFVLAKKPGPYALFARLRTRTTIGGLLLCPPCLVVWVAALCFLLWHTALAPLVVISAIAGGATVLGYFSGTWQQ